MGLFTKPAKIPEPPPFTPVAQIGTKPAQTINIQPQPPDFNDEERQLIESFRKQKQQEKQIQEEQVTNLKVCPTCGAVYGKPAEE